ncbi:MAG: hypothetical protein F4Y01_05255 [Gammaproteobacteria bacterium]|nr:hypothetical protein [Gammaproteobacteria bacterium]
MKNLGMVAAIALLATGCSVTETVKTVGAVVFAPVTALIMTVEARRNDRWALVERARKNDAPPPTIDADSTERARGAIEKALEHGAVGQDFYWENADDAELGAISGRVMIATDQEDGARRCRDVYMATYFGHDWDQRVKTYCRDGDSAWRDGTETAEG